ncbi:hypothetical protein [Pedobacter sandarakinus]|uniref:hypothetical protein n=1 Tax=Pedobacter sandarakinus TaxID=353156 RepID=UPI0022450F67|nr:hypothetical protein [Pedobacter sandarakinus]MCX2573627.1 hypothetical protein [Pedobacter sandarakinus]
MIFNVLKTILITVLFSFFVSPIFAQSNYFKWSVGLSAGPNFSKTDVVNGNWGYTVQGEINHHFTPFVTAGLEAHYGMVQGGDIVTDPHNRQFINKYTGINANFKVMLGELINYDRSSFLDNIKGLYAGIGLGAVKNNITDIVRYKPSWAAYDPGYGPFPGEDKSVNLWIPFNLGLNYYLYDGYGYLRYVINFNAQSNFTFGEGLDGYNDSPTKFRNYGPDTFNAYTIGFKYFFGTIRSYRKSL